MEGVMKDYVGVNVSEFQDILDETAREVGKRWLETLVTRMKCCYCGKPCSASIRICRTCLVTRQIPFGAPAPDVVVEE